MYLSERSRRKHARVLEEPMREFGFGAHLARQRKHVGAVIHTW